MTSYGKAENEKLRKNLEEQLDRLFLELEFLEESREELGESAYNEEKESIMEQLREFNDRLQRLTSGNVSLVDELGSMQLAIQAAISAAFKTPAVIRMFGKREPNQLREKLAQIDRDIKLGKVSQDAGESQKGEVLNALKQLGEKLESAELELLEKLSLKDVAKANFVKVNDSVEKSQIALTMADKAIKAAQST